MITIKDDIPNAVSACTGTLKILGVYTDKQGLAEQINLFLPITSIFRIGLRTSKILIEYNNGESDLFEFNVKQFQEIDRAIGTAYGATTLEIKD